MSFKRCAWHTEYMYTPGASKVIFLLEVVRSNTPSSIPTTITKTITTAADLEMI